MSYVVFKLNFIYFTCNTDSKQIHFLLHDIEVLLLFLNPPKSPLPVSVAENMNSLSLTDHTGITRMMTFRLAQQSGQKS